MHTGSTTHTGRGTTVCINTGLLNSEQLRPHLPPFADAIVVNGGGGGRTTYKPKTTHPPPRAHAPCAPAQRQCVPLHKFYYSILYTAAKSDSYRQQRLHDARPVCLTVGGHLLCRLTVQRMAASQHQRRTQRGQQQAIPAPGLLFRNSAKPSE